MSTVLRPVGPYQPRVYWIRRAVVLGVIAVIVIVAVAVLSGGSGKPGKPAARHDSPAPTVTPTTPAATQVLPCDPSVLKLVLSTDSDSYTSGQSAKLSGVFRNPSATACTLTKAPSTENWTITSGTDVIWSTKGCAAKTAAKQVTIKAGGTKTVSVFWNGERRDSTCTVGAVAQPGEYVLSGTLDGVKGVVAIFHVTS